MGNTRAVTLNLTGDFENPWKHTTVEEIQRINSFFWAPATDSWDAIMGMKLIKVASFSQFLGIIQKQEKKSIIRINLWSHGNPGLIAFKGIIDKTTKVEERLVMLNTGTALDKRILDPAAISKNSGSALTANLALMAYLLSDRFAPNAELFLYLCHSGSDWELLQRIADAFQIKVHGFSEEIWVCPSTDMHRRTIDRNFTNLSGCNGKLKGYGHLHPNVNRPPTAWSKEIKETIETFQHN